MGHSSSGGYIGEQLANGTAPFEAAVLLQPVVDNEGPAAFSKKMPLLVVQGQCDEQAAPTDVASYVPLASKRNQGKAVIHAETLGATHIAQIGGGNHHTGLVSPVKGLACADAKLAKPAPVRAVTAVMVAEFLKQAFAGSTTFTLPTHPSAVTNYKSGNSAATVRAQPLTAVPADLPAAKVNYLSSKQMVLPKFTGKRIADGEG